MTKAAFTLAVLTGMLVANPASAEPVAAELTAVHAAIGHTRGLQSPSSGEAAQSAELVDFNYPRFFERAFRIGIPTQRIEYVVTVGPDGKAIDCALTADFRYDVTNRILCRQIKRVAQFAPARDAQGNAVTGTYRGEVMIMNIITPLR